MSEKARYEREIAVSPQEHDPLCRCGGRYSQHEVVDLFDGVECRCGGSWHLPGGKCPCKQFKEAK